MLFRGFIATSIGLRRDLYRRWWISWLPRTVCCGNCRWFPATGSWREKIQAFPVRSLARVVWHRYCSRTSLRLSVWPHTRGPHRKGSGQFIRGQNTWSWLQGFALKKGVTIEYSLVESRKLDQYAIISRKWCELGPSLLLDAESHIREFNWDENRWPWMTLNNCYAPMCVYGVQTSLFRS